jgi:PAS domain S-box-containing protein
MAANKPKRPNTRDTLDRQKAISEALFLSIGEGAVATDENANISNVNQVALDLLGFSRDELVGKWFPNALVATFEDGRRIPTLERPITKSFLSGKTISTQCYYLKKDGSLLPVALNVSPVLIGEKPVGAIEVFRDITEELEVDRMKSEFISLASHQLRTPATAVKTYLSLLIDGFRGELTDKQKSLAETAYTSNERQLQIINDLLMVANTESRSLKLKKEKLDLRMLISEVVEQQIGSIAKRKQKMHVRLPQKRIIHEIDPSFFKMVVDNLLSNASKYTPEEGHLTLQLKKTDGKVELAVSDTGVGIEPTDIDRLFQKFSRIDNPLSIKAGGSGIGLYLLKQIVDLHGGFVTVESEKGKGTTFTVALPVKEMDEMAAIVT